MDIGGVRKHRDNTVDIITSSYSYNTVNNNNNNNTYTIQLLLFLRLITNLPYMYNILNIIINTNTFI